MSTWLLVLAILTLLATAGLAVQVWLGFLRLKKLEDFPPAYGTLPKVSLVVAARNEERQIEAAVRSLLKLDYDNLEITIVNDRSTDQTGEILRRLASEFPQINLVEIDTLPAGWLGKNHALQHGAEHSHGDWILFTDADIHFAPQTLRRAMGYVEQYAVDHLTLAPETTMPTWWLQSLIVTFSLMFHIFINTWKVSDPRSKAHIGIGAFNLVRAKVYRDLGGHQRIAMRPDDDVKLGKIIKDGGYRQHVLNGIGQTRVEWYGSLREMIVGLEKNSFAVMEYNLARALFGVASLFLVTIWPFVALALIGGWTWWFNLGTVLIWLMLGMVSANALRVPLAMCLTFPLANLVFCFINLRSMWITLRTGGIRWRDTFYSLAELKANRV